MFTKEKWINFILIVKNARTLKFLSKFLWATNSFLLKLGDGRLPIDSDGLIALPFGQMASTREELKEKIFQNFQSFQSNNLPNKQYLVERTTLTPRNDDVDYISKTLTDSFPREVKHGEQSQGVHPEDSLDSNGSPLSVQATPVSGQTLLLYDHQQSPRTDT